MNIFTPRNSFSFRTLYKHVDDVDFFVGGMSEKPVSGGLLGWTFLCVVGDQFARVKKGDRFFYDIGGQPGSFTDGEDSVDHKFVVVCLQCGTLHVLLLILIKSNYYTLLKTHFID